MTYFTTSGSYPSFDRFIILVAVIALPVLGAYAQEPAGPDAGQKNRPCSVGTNGAVTYLVKDGVELSVNEDWDCDRVEDAYDNCVGMANPEQADSDANGVGDVCEAASFAKADAPAKSRSVKRPASRAAKTRSVKRRAGRRAKARPTARSKPKAKKRTSIAAGNRPAKKRRIG